jgi:hypothetical protein
MSTNLMLPPDLDYVQTVDFVRSNLQPLQKMPSQAKNFGLEGSAPATVELNVLCTHLQSDPE